MDYNNIVPAPPEWDTWELELVERLHTAAYAAEQIAVADEHHVATLKRELRHAELRARVSATRYKKLYSQVWKLAKKHGVTSIRYDGGSHTSRASIG